jgi:hypothetical protein
LLDKEVLLKSDLEKLIGPRPYEEKPIIPIPVHTDAAKVVAE